MPTYASDGDCDGGGPGAEYLGCQLGTDCAGADCGPRFRLPPPICAETCNWASDDDCYEPTTAAPVPIVRCVCVCVYIIYLSLPINLGMPMALGGPFQG
jgi:hypothetical protein